MHNKMHNKMHKHDVLQTIITIITKKNMSTTRTKKKRESRKTFAIRLSATLDHSIETFCSTVFFSK